MERRSEANRRRGLEVAAARTAAASNEMHKAANSLQAIAEDTTRAVASVGAIRMNVMALYDMFVVPIVARVNASSTGASPSGAVLQATAVPTGDLAGPVSGSEPEPVSADEAQRC